MDNTTKRFEVERKFLIRLDVLRNGSAFAAASKEKLTQGYVANKPTVRVRLAGDLTAPEAAWLTIKGPGKMVREEYEFRLDDTAQALKLLRSMASGLIEKTRYTLTHQESNGAQRTWTVDEFHGRHEGLWLAEVELSDQAEPFEQPTWLSEEVTEDSRYSNSYLAENDRP